MSKSSVVIFCMTQFDELAARYVEDGVPVLRAERQADVDGARRLLLSDAFKKYRRDPAPEAPPGRITLTP